MLMHMSHRATRVPTLIESRERTERQIATAVVAALIGAGYIVAVYDGERYVQTPSAALGDVARALLTVEEDHLHVYLPTERGPLMTGWVQLRYGGHGWDTLADYSPRLREALTPALTLADELRTRRAPGKGKVVTS